MYTLIGMTHKVVISILITLVLFISQTSADMPMPSDVEVIGCVNGSTMIVVSATGADYREYYPWIGSLKEYTITPGATYPPYQPFVPENFTGKMLKLNTGLDIRDDIIVSPTFIAELGPCSSITYYGCVLDGLLLCSDYSYGNVSRYPEGMKTDSRVLMVKTPSGDELNLIPYNEKNISITAQGQTFSHHTVSEIIAQDSDIQVIGNVTRPISKFILRPYEKYWIEKSEINPTEMGNIA